jgi:hypothetical protein
VRKRKERIQKKRKYRNLTTEGRRKNEHEKLTIFDSSDRNPAKYPPFLSIIKTRKKISKQEQKRWIPKFCLT